MYISVIPLRHSQSKRPYTYFVWEVWHESIVLGGIVEIPIGKHTVSGIVAEVGITLPADLTIEDIRAIVCVIASIEIMSPSLISMIVSIADRYFLLIHKVASMCLPAPLLSRLDKKNYILSRPPRFQDSKILSVQPSNLPTLKRSTTIHHYIDSIFSPSDIESYIIPGSVFIFPDDILLSIFMRSLETSIQEKIWIFPTDLTPTRRVGSWIDTYEKRYDIIFWTRRLLYYNLHAYDHIIYIEDAFGTEQYSYPIRIQHLDILKAIEYTDSHDITIVSSTPTLSLFATFPKRAIISKR